jgi:L-asparaginase II
MPLEAMARAYARFAQAVGRDDDVPARIAHAMRTRPFLIGGTDRFDTALLEETDGAVLAKIGAEGMHSVAVLDQGIGLAVKVEDGAPRAQFPAVLRLLQSLDALPATLPPRLAEFLVRPVRNTRGEVVGDVVPVA